MACTKMLILVALIAGVYQVGAQFAGAGAYAGGGNFAGGMFGPNFPFGPGGFPNLPQPPALPIFGPVTFPTINLPSPADIVNMKPGPNSNSHGVMTVSRYSSKVGPDGETVKTGGTTVFTNDNGKVKEIKFGDNPPNVDSDIHTVQSSWTQMPKIEMPDIPEIKMPKIPKIKMPKIPKIKMPKIPKVKMPQFPGIEIPDIPEIVIPDIPEIMIPDIPEMVIPDIPEIKMPDFDQLKNYVPSEGQNFVSISSVSQSHSFDENGKNKNVGHVKILINNNGKVHSEVIHFGDDGAKDDHGENVKSEEAEEEEGDEVEGEVRDEGEDEEEGGEEKLVGDKNDKKNGKVSDDRKEKDKAQNKDQENKVDTGNDENKIKEKILGDMDKYEIV